MVVAVSNFGSELPNSSPYARRQSVPLRKFPPNALIRRLYGASVLSNNGAQWKRHRLILNELFTEKAAAEHHHTIVQATQQLIEQWRETLSKAQIERLEIKSTTSKREDKTAAKQQALPDKAHIDLCQNFNALFLKIVIQITVGRSVDALKTNADNFLENLACITKASTQPQHQFVRWWRFLPLPQNYRLTQALTEIDDFFEELIAQSRFTQHPSAESKETVQSTAVPPKTVLDKLLQASSESAGCPLSQKEVKDNLLAIIGNGYETAATTLSMTLQALAQNSKALACSTEEVQSVIKKHGGQLTPAAVAELVYVEAVLYESMRLYPAVAGLQRVSLAADDGLAGWSIPAGQAVGVALQPLHLDSKFYGKAAETFVPERYLSHCEETRPAQDIEKSFEAVAQAAAAESRCPFGRLMRKSKVASSDSVALPLTFGYGARQCLAKHLALYEMKIVLAMLLNAFTFELVDEVPVELELGKFGLFLSAFPKTAVTLAVGLH